MITWNSGRLYTEHGQRFGAEMSLYHEGQVAFYDIDRQIFGLLPPEVKLDKRSIMAAYDNGDYDHIALYVEGYVWDLGRRVRTAFLGE